MSWKRYWTIFAWSAAAAALVVTVPAGPAAAQKAPDALCFLESFEVEMEEDRAMDHAVEMEVRCAIADRTVLDVEQFDLKLLDGDADLVEAGVAWMEGYIEAGGQEFFSSQPTNDIEVSETGRERTIQLRAHSHAIPETGVARLRGTVDLLVEADCIGEGAIEPVTVQATAGALRSSEPIALEDGGEIVTTEQGQHGDSPMLALTGAGSYVGLVDPPEGVEEVNFFGKKRFVVNETAAADAEVTLHICPTEVVAVPVDIEAAV